MEILHAIGVGPGDPDLLTIKAVNLIRQAQAIYHAGPGDRQGRALRVIQSRLKPEQSVRTILTRSMNEVTEEGQAAYRQGVEQMAADCRNGRRVVFITEGDPSLYSTAVVVRQMLAELAPDVVIEFVPGVSSMTAAAAYIGWPLARKEELLAIVPGGYYQSRLRELIETFPNVCLFKAARIMPMLANVLSDFGRQRQAVYVENLGTPQQWITYDLAAAVERRNYFSLVLIRNTASQEKSTSNGGEWASAGKVSVVGLGPGDPELLTRRALSVLQKADVVIGYEGYLRQLAVPGLRAYLEGSPIGAETQRATRAIELAGSGKRVALVSSGDAGVYGMASLLLETATTSVDLEIEIIPGVTAATAAAALLGAPLGHDFACISLSDLLTSWETIESRIAAVGQGDFVLAIYNPLSAQRSWQLPRAKEILLRHRSPDTPVGLVDRAYRPGMRTWITTLENLSVDGIGMETIILVGNNQTRIINGRMVTPRGYPSQPPRFAKPENIAPNTSNRVPQVGREILEESFAIIERELGPHSLPSWLFLVLRRMIHASADFEYRQTLRHNSGFVEAIAAAFRERVPIITDTEMLLLGIRSILANGVCHPPDYQPHARNQQADAPRLPLLCYLNDMEAVALSSSSGLTRSAAGIRLAARRHPQAVLAIGNAPTALEEALRLIATEGWRPRAIIAMPVGFVGVEEAKRRLLEQANVPYLTCVGRKGGSAVTAAAINALWEWWRETHVPSSAQDRPRSHGPPA